MGRSTMKAWLLVGLLLATAGYVIAEEITLTTYYPSPRGVYQELRSTNSTFLAYNSGNVGIGTDQPDAQAKLDVSGPVRMGNFDNAHQPPDNSTGQPCAEGALYYNTDHHEFRGCMQGFWKPFGNAPVPTGWYGSCSESSGVGPPLNIDASCGASAPATCSGITCVCPAADYVKTVTGSIIWEPDPPGHPGMTQSATSYSCLKK
ncbi:MAG: hypothetical protein HY737_04030 [Candidatus Omnitrophica bacterium]|nr:hypothetical protein [Candidatus Omnitrophota bacterium]